MSRLDDVLALVAIDSVSGNEAALADYVADRLGAVPVLSVVRVGDNVVARTSGDKERRVILAGHLDTVPGDVSAAHIDKDRLVGLGSCDMKASVAVMLELASNVAEANSEITFVFYAREEIARSESGLLEIAKFDAKLLAGDVAILGEPTGGVVEAGCQGTLRLALRLRGERAHTARPFTGRNAIHRLAPVLKRIADYEPRTVALDGVSFTEQLQAVLVEGGVAANVVPDEVCLTINHRVAPDRGEVEAVAWLRSYLGEFIEEGDELSVLDWAPAARPALDLEALQSLVAVTGAPARGKVGWTDVATFVELGVPATNFGAGDPLLAHRREEFVTLEEVDTYAAALRRWLFD